MQQTLKLSKSETINIVSNTKALNKDIKERKLVLHFNSKYQDDFENDRVRMQDVENYIALATNVVFEMDSGTFSKY